MISKFASVLGLAFLATACASTSVQNGSQTAAADNANEDEATYTAPAKPETPEFTRVDNPYHAEIFEGSTRQERDRRAILAMRGEYRVDFNFEETVKLAPGYERRDDKVTGGWETVFVISETPTEIVLQHILVTPGGHVVKHWRQDWIFEAEERFEFAADQTWALQKIDPDLTRGAWTQCVYEVSDAPRYCGTGEWQHELGASTWTSDFTWRPLPRREYTIRDDYNALGAINRHTITPSGWTHEQDNVKSVRDGAVVEANLVREFGFNDYYNIEGFDFQPAYEYWDRTEPFWAHVRAAWDKRLWTGEALELTTEVDGMPIIEGTFELAEQMPEISDAEQVEAIESLLNEWTRPVGLPVAAR